MDSPPPMIKAYASRKGNLFVTKRMERIRDLFNSGQQVWIDLSEPSDEEITSIVKLARLHPITSEDVQSANTRIKFEVFDFYNYIVFWGARSIEGDVVSHYQVHFIIGKNFLITLHHLPNARIAKLMRSKRGKALISKGVDYILHQLLDDEIDSYFPLVQDLYEEVEELDDLISEDPDESNFEELYNKKRVTLRLKRVLTPTIGVFSRINKVPKSFLSGEVSILFNDVTDHVIRIEETLQACKERISDIVDEHHAVSSHKMNDIIRILTIISTIMLPLTLLSGIYGMNLPYLPWASSRYAFLIILFIMALIAGGLLLYFKRKKWI